jgi:hypothetical protein
VGTEAASAQEETLVMREILCTARDLFLSDVEKF